MRYVYGGGSISEDDWAMSSSDDVPACFAFAREVIEDDGFVNLSFTVGDCIMRIDRQGVDVRIRYEAISDDRRQPRRDEVPVTRVELLTRPTISGNLVSMFVETRSWRMP